MNEGRLVIVSNRLPVNASLTDGKVRLSRAAGGLATGLERWHAQAASIWVGWPGDVSAFQETHLEALERRLAERQVKPVYLSRAEIEKYYESFANGVIWPLFHYLADRVPAEAESGWEAYKSVNEKFADAVAGIHREGDVIWVHDYQLLLLPALLRERLPEAQIGFFLHIPFPSSEVFRILPWRSEILRGLLGADLIGFHTFSYLRHFVASLLHVEGIETDVDAIQVSGRRVRLGVYPMGVDAKAFETLARDPSVIAEAAAIREDAAGRTILLGVDRLDYTKGIPRRLLAIERLLAENPSLQDQIRYVQIAVPSREAVESYRKFRRQVEETVGRINGARSTLHSMPVHYLHRSVSRKQLVALYCAADVMLVTPLRDGMNLVAKEFVASRVDGDGVLVLSEFAGAASELGEAVVVNPYDTGAVAAAIIQAIQMPKAERRTRMLSLRRRVLEHDIHRWADRFIDGLRSAAAARPKPERATGAALTRVIESLRDARLSILLDYDGTLVPIARSPELAAPDEALILLLMELARRPDTTVHLVSGRPRDTLDAWFAHVPVTLWAEHGLWHRPGPRGEWQQADLPPTDALRRIYPILEQFTTTTPGSLIEEKTASIAWHYRMAEPEFGTRQAHELRMLLGEALSNQPLEVLEGKKVIEVRLRGVNKAVVSQRVVAEQYPDATVLAIGDDRTDEDLFSALPDTSITIAVGTGRTQARYFVDDYRAVRQLLRMLLP
jgi:trehalose 6-phosphate synthase/phosphatase